MPHPTAIAASLRGRDRRGLPRHTFNRTGRVQGDFGTRNCLIVNLSEGGARLWAEGALSPEFILSIEFDGGRQRRQCKLVWRLEDEIGVQFID